MLLEKSGEIALGAEAEMFGNLTDLILLLAQPADRRLDAKGIGVDPRADAGTAAEQVIEMRAGQAGKPGDVIEIDCLGRTLAHMP